MADESNGMPIPPELSVALMGKINPQGGKASGELNPNFLSAQNAAAEAEIAARAANGGKAPSDTSTTPPGTPPATDKKDENEETDEQIQAKLDALAAKEESTYTDEEKAYIAKYTSANETVIQGVQNLFTEKYGLAFNPEDKFDESPEGLAALVDAVAPQVANNMLAQYFQQIPIMEQFFNHVVREGKSFETFMTKNEKPAFENIKLQEITDDMPEIDRKSQLQSQKDILTMYYNSLNVPKEDIAALIELAESAGQLFNKAGAAKTALKTEHQAKVAAALEAEIQRQAVEKQQVDALWKNVDTIITKNDFGNGRSIPPADIAGFKAAVFNRDAQGNTMLDYKKAKLSLADQLFADYIIYKDFKLSNYQKPPEQTKKFQFQSNSKANDARNGGRTRGAGDSRTQGQHPKLDATSFGNIMNNRQQLKNT